MPSDASGPQCSGKANLLERFKPALFRLCLQLIRCCLGDDVAKTNVKPKDEKEMSATKTTVSWRHANSRVAFTENLPCATRQPL